jgi:hypothetical protein
MPQAWALSDPPRLNRYMNAFIPSPDKRSAKMLAADEMYVT